MDFSTHLGSGKLCCRFIPNSFNFALKTNYEIYNYLSKKGVLSHILKVEIILLIYL